MPQAQIHLKRLLLSSPRSLDGATQRLAGWLHRHLQNNDNVGTTQTRDPLRHLHLQKHRFEVNRYCCSAYERLHHKGENVTYYRDCDTNLSVQLVV